MQPYNVYAIGQTALIEAFNRNDAGDLVSPTDPRILLKPPTGSETELAVTENPEGHIFHALRLTAPGKYHYRILTSDDAVERFFVVVPSAFTEPLPE